jgi:hypothetical protein
MLVLEVLLVLVLVPRMHRHALLSFDTTVVPDPQGVANVGRVGDVHGVAVGGTEA